MATRVGPLLAVVAAAACLAATFVQAQQPPAGSRTYDPATVESLSGVVERIDRIKESPSGKGFGIHIFLKTASEAIDVHLGPSWFIDEQSMKITKGERIDVRGSRVEMDGKPAIIAAEVRKGSEVLVLRDAAGLPAWRGQRGKGRAAKP